MLKQVRIFSVIGIPVITALLFFSNCVDRFTTKAEVTPQTRLAQARRSPEKTEKFYTELITNGTPFKNILWPNSYTDFGGIKRITLFADNLFIETGDGKSLFALDTVSGNTKWVFQEGELLFPPAIIAELPLQVERLRKERDELIVKYQDERYKKGVLSADLDKMKTDISTLKTNIETKLSRDSVYVTVGLTLFCLTRSGGDRLWSKELKFVPSGTPCPSENVTYIPAMGNDRIYMANNFDPIAVTQNWFHPSGRITSNIVYSDPFIYYATDNNRIYAMMADEVRWDYDVESKIAADIVLAKASPTETFILAASTDYAIYALNKNTGKEHWKFETGAPITTTPSVSSGQVYVLSDNNAMFCLSLLDGKEIWRSPLYKKFLARGKERVYMYGMKGEICAVDEKTGEKLDTYPVPARFDFILADPETSIVYFVTRDGFIFAATESELKY